MTIHEGAEAWRVPPGAYREGRAKEAAIGAPASRYLALRDGCRLAIDVYLPERFDGEARRVPTILILTPYYRRFRLKPGSASEPSPNAGKYRDAFVPYGYAVVVVDTRGTGASFGTRDSFRSPREREDAREIADWIAAQTWSDGTIGATGISYLGAGADFLAATGHPAVRAIAPLFSVWDTYADNYYPGGILLTGLTRVYDEIMIGLDHDRRDVLKQFAYFSDPSFEGPQPVDEDPDGVLVREAVREHLANFRQTDFMAEFRYRDDALPYDPSFTSASFSPYSLREHIRPDVAVCSVSGWRDGAGYANGAIARHLTLDGNPRHLLLGPWDHGARIDTSPWRRSVEPSFPWLAELLRFFDHYLMGRDTGLDAEAKVHTFAMHEEAWHAAEEWPPARERRVFGLQDGGRLEAPFETPPGGSPSPGGGGSTAKPAGWGDTRLSSSSALSKVDAAHHPIPDLRSDPPPPGEGETAARESGRIRGRDRGLAAVQVDFALGTGTGTRYERIAGIDSRDYYPDWTERVGRLAGWESEPFADAATLTGHALVDLTLASSEPDAALFVYLTEIEADGRARYITEGLLRALHRAEAPCPPEYRTSWPFRTFSRQDAKPLVPGIFERIRIPCLPVSWRIAAGSRLRLSIAGADADHCGQVPHGRPPLLTLDLARCVVELPVAEG